MPCVSSCFACICSSSTSGLLALDTEGSCHFQVICKKNTGTRSFANMLLYLEVSTQFLVRIGRFVADSRANKGAGKFFTIFHSFKRQHVTECSLLLLFFPEAALWSMRPGQSKRVRKRTATIYMNLGGARFAGETVRRNYSYRSWITVSNKNTTKPGHDPPRNPGSFSARSPETRARSKQTTKRGDQLNGRSPYTNQSLFVEPYALYKYFPSIR